MKKVKLKVKSCKGRLVRQYPGQAQEQGRYIEVSQSGRLLIDWNSEIGSAVPSAVGHGIRRRIHGNWRTKAEALYFIRENRELFQRLVAGMGETWDGNNNIGTLTEDAREALNDIEYAAYDEDESYIVGGR